ncbi:hypothetical protein Dimus_025937 [Dionaea muscipula]
MGMGSQGRPLHVLMFPFMAYGHMIPTLDIARLFASRGAKITIATTPLNAPVFTGAMDDHDHEHTINFNSTDPEINIGIKIYPFPSKEAGLPEGVENLDNPVDEEMTDKFLRGIDMLQGTLERLIEEFKPNVLVADLFFPWATDVAAKFNIPRLVFHGTNSFSFCVWENINLYQPHKIINNIIVSSSSSEDHDQEFLVPNLPHEIRLTRSQLPSLVPLRDAEEEEKSVLVELLKRALEADRKSFGVIMNSFYELEPAYVDHLRQALGRRAWPIGPVSLFNVVNRRRSNIAVEDKRSIRGKKSAIDEEECLKWLDSKEPNSVVYVSFGSIAKFPISQLHEIAGALEASGQDFIWVVRGYCCRDDHIIENFEKRMELEGRGLIIRGWAPQVVILEHRATGGFVTHCGWNSTLEAISAGVPMVTWPVFAEQFYNQKLITEILRIGIPVGAKKQISGMILGDAKSDNIVDKKSIENSVRRVMVGEEAAEISSRVTELKELAWKAVDEGGSSYQHLSDLLQQLSHYRA